MSLLTVESAENQGSGGGTWVPTHVQVTVLRARGLRGKGKHGAGSDVYTIIQLAKEKYSTGVAERTTEPEWREECVFELGPGALEGGQAGGGGGSSGTELVLTVMHRGGSVMGLDVFLGQAVVHLDRLYRESRCVKNEWYKLNSKSGKKEKERGDIQVTVTFTRNNLTASMHDLVMKDKGASTFGKLKERIKGKKRPGDEDFSLAAVPPGGYGSLHRMRQRLPSDGGGEEEYEDDEGGEARRSKMRTFFLRGKLRKSSDTRSSTSLGSESSESSSRGGSLSPTAGISVVVSDLSNSPSNSSNLTADNSPEHTGNLSPSSSLKCEYGDDDDEPCEFSIAVPQRPAACVNGGHAYDSVRPPVSDPGSGGKPADSLGLGLLQKTLPLSVSLQNLRPPSDLPKGIVGDGRRWSFDKPDEEEKAAIAAALEKSGPMVGDEEEYPAMEATSPKAASSSSSVTESESQGKKQRRNLFSHGGKSGEAKNESEHASTEERHSRGWFGSSKDSHSKPSLVVSPKLEPRTNPHPKPPPLPRNQHPPGPPVFDPASLGSPLHHTNPFCRTQTPTPPPMSPCNPFFSLQQHNPFYKDMLNPSLPPLPYLSSSRPPITQLFPQTSNPNPDLTRNRQTTEDPVVGTDPKREAIANSGRRPLPPVPTKEKEHLNEDWSKAFMFAGQLEPDSEWDEGFEAFAAGRLQSPEELTTDSKIQPNTHSDHPLEHCNNKGSWRPGADSNQNNVNDALQHQRCTEFVFEAHRAAGQATNINTHHFDAFAQFLETIPEHTSFETDQITPNSLADSPQLDACTETNEANSNTTNTTDLTNTNMHQDHNETLSVKPDSVSPDPGSSGLGSSAEEDFLSCVSSYSDKFSASSSSEETEAHHFESSVLSFEKSVESVLERHLQPVDSENDITDRSNDPSLVDVAQGTFIQHSDGDEKVDINGLKGSLAPQSPVLTNQEPVMAATETGTEDAVTEKLSETQPNLNFSPQFDNEKEEKDICEFKGSPEDFSKVSVESVVSVSDRTDVVTTNDELCSTYPSFNIITSSPEERQSTLHLPIKRNDSDGPDHHSSVPFGLFGDLLDTSNIYSSTSEGFDDAHLRVSDQSASSSFLQSLYVTTDSQDYQTCGSDQSSDWSNQTQHSANSTLCAELTDVQTTANTSASVGQEDSNNESKPSNDENQIDQFEKSIGEAKDKKSTLEPIFKSGDDFGSEDSASASKPSNDEIKPTDRSEESAVESEVKISSLQPDFTYDNDFGLQDSTNAFKPSNEDIKQTDLFEKSVIETKANLPTFEPSFTLGDDFHLQDSADEFKPSKEEIKLTEELEESAVESDVKITSLEPGFTSWDDFVLQNPTNAFKPSNDETQLTFGEPLVETKDILSTFEPGFTFGDDFGLEAASKDSHMTCNRSEFAEGVKSPQIILSDTSQLQNATLHRSQSEGTLAPAFDELLLPSFGSDPGAIKEESFLPDLPPLTSFDPPLTPDSSSSPVVFCSFANLDTEAAKSTLTDATPTETSQQQGTSQQNSPHPVKPLTTATPADERRSEGRSVLISGLEKLKSTISPGRSQAGEQEGDRKKSLTEGAGSYYHLNHSELVSLLVQREAELERQRAESDRQRTLLAKREVELRRLKPQVRDLEDYIDTLLVRIMEQKPTLLQVRTKLK